jgi:hypothetical protein
MKNKWKYIVTDVVSISVCQIMNKEIAYKIATKPGYGIVDWYNEKDNYIVPVTRDKEDKTQKLCCDENSNAILFSHYREEFVISYDKELNMKEAPSQAETIAIIISNDGYSFWEKDKGNIKIFVTYDENGLVNNFRLDNWAGKSYEDEIEISFNDLQSEEDYNTKDRADIFGTIEFFRRRNV